MTYLYDHIQELRAELRFLYLTRRERRQIEQELAQAIAEQAALDRAFAAQLEALTQAGR